MENYIFWLEIGSGFGEPGGTPPPRIPRSTPRDSGHQIVFETPEGVLTKARVPSKICNYGNYGSCTVHALILGPVYIEVGDPR